MEQKDIQHLYWRAGFGINPSQLETFSNLSKKDVVNNLFKASKKTSLLNIDISELTEIISKESIKDKDVQKKIREINTDKIKEFNNAWIERLMNPQELLRERMTLFWANHFVCRDNNIKFVQQYNNTLRKYALGDFREFVKAISKEPAMLKYLNNKQNVKRNPNENFARELMELFTLGEGHYTEKDIKESARAFTGYFHDLKGSFVLRKKRHDFGRKVFFGKSGFFDGDDIIDIILSQKQCAKFICERIYKYFVNPKVNTVHINLMVNELYNDYNIERLMHFVFSSKWFYSKKNIGCKIKSPIELLVGIQNVIPMKFEKTKDLFAIQKLLGQILLYPPNVSGWEGDKQWIDSNTILLRMRLPSLLFSNAKIPLKEKGDFSDTFYNKLKKNFSASKFFKVESNWEFFENQFSNVSINDIDAIIIQTQLNIGTREFVNNLYKSSKKEYCIQLMSLPEYQMC